MLLLHYRKCGRGLKTRTENRHCWVVLLRVIENNIMNSPVLHLMVLFLMVLFTDISLFNYNYNNYQVNVDSENDHNRSIYICSLKVHSPC